MLKVLKKGFSKDFICKFAAEQPLSGETPELHVRTAPFLFIYYKRLIQNILFSLWFNELIKESSLC